MIGGGITGLAAAHAWTKEMPGAPVTVLEEKDTPGGKLRTEYRDGLQIETGADSFLDRDGAVAALCEELGVELVAPALFGGLVTRAGRLLPLPAGTVMGVPASVRGVMSSQTLSVGGKVRALRDLLSPAPLRGPDVAVGRFIRSRFGREVLEFQVDPILAGTRAGDADRLSLAAALPQIDAAARRSRSLIRGLGAARKRDPEGGAPPAFLAPVGGLSSLVAALVDALGEGALLTSSAATSLRRAGGSWEIGTSAGIRNADAVILATPAHVTGALLEEASPRAALAAGKITFASVAVVTLVFGHEIETPAGSGVLIAGDAEMAISAATWYSKKWPHVARGRTVVRAFIGRAGHDPALASPDDALVARVLTELGSVAGIHAEPSTAWVTRWDKGLPQYLLGHKEIVAEAKSALADHPTIRLAGASYDGSGIPDCIRQGREAARHLAAAVAGRAGDRVGGTDIPGRT